MTNESKARIYEDCIRESDRLQRENSKLKSEYAGHIPAQIQQTIDKNEKRIAELVTILESLFKN